MKKPFPFLLPLLVSLSVCGLCIAVAIYANQDLPQLPPLIAEPAA